MSNARHPDLIEQNRDTWDTWAGAHVSSEFYDTAGFLQGRDTLDRYTTRAWGDRVAGRRLLHLQCHFGQDTLSWARRGAQVVGVDFSPVAVREATALAARAGLSERARFVQASVLDPIEGLGAPFDFVFASYGVLTWLPSLEGWAANIARWLRPGGSFWLVEAHPTLMVFDDNRSALPIQLGYDHFQRDVMTFTEPGSYAAPELPTTTAHEWMYRLADIINALIGAGLQIRRLEEYPVCRWKALPVLVPCEDPAGFWRLPDEARGRFPLMFGLEAVRPAER